MTPNSPHKLYCYVDETGQDTQGELFLVAVVLTGSKREQLTQVLESLEQTSGKGKVKWSNTKKPAREAYIRLVLNEPLFQGLVYYACYHNTTDYVALTVQTIAQTVLHRTQGDHQGVKVTVIVDGLPKSQYRQFGTKLRQQWHIRTEKVRGASDEANAFIRLTDALCGFLRQAQDQVGANQLQEKAMREGYIIELGEE